MKKPTLEISATAFKASCLAIFRALEARRYTHVIVTRRGKPIATLMPPPKQEVPDLWGCMRGTVTIAPGADLTAPVLDEPMDAERGILHR